MRVSPVESIISEPVKYRVLIVSNKMDEQNIIQSVLQDQDKYISVGIDDPDKILKHLGESSYHLLIIDIDGKSQKTFDIISSLKNSHEDLPVILLADPSVKKELELFQSKLDDCIFRPINRTEIEFRINRTMEFYRLLKTRDSLVKENKELWGRAITDKLTGLYNRSYFEEIYSSEFERTKRYRSQLGCLLFDIDHFKKVNDDFGHLIGDLVLEELGSIILGTIRKVDIAARYGGEEFVILMPETTRDGTKHVGERMRKLIEDFKFCQNSRALDNPMRQVTISVGAVHYPDEQISEPMTLLKIVDNALYRAKKNGRNRLETSWEEDE